MSYESTTLVARRYGAMGADPTCGPNQVYRSNVTWAGAKGQCLTQAQYAECQSTGKLMGSPCSVASSGGVVDTIKSIGGALVSLWGQSKAPPATSPTVVQGGTPDWLMPVAIGAIGIAAVVLLTKKRKNPSRRRRRNSSTGGGGSKIGMSRREVFTQRKRGGGYFTWRGKVRTHAKKNPSRSRRRRSRR